MIRITFNGMELTDGLTLIGTQGLGSSEAEISITEYASMYGGVVSRCRIPSREIVLSYAVVGCKPEEARIRARNVFVTGAKGTLGIKTPYKDLVTEAYVKRVECDLWRESQQLDVTLSCPDPYLYAPTSKTAVRGSNQWAFSNDGEPVGAVFQVSRYGFIRMSDSEERLEWNAVSAVSSGTVLTLDTREGHRDLYYMNGTTKVSLLAYITGWNWFLIPNGESVVRSSAVSGDATFTERWSAI